MNRPEGLPDFSSPPLHEVVLGIQFDPIPNYSTIYAAEIWQLFKNNFPRFEEHVLMEPAFETFGGRPQSGVQFRLGSGPVGSRFWFLSEEGDHLLQFQHDRFIVNWRMHGDGNRYPRFEVVLEQFEKNFQILCDFIIDKFEYSPNANQLEITYVNIIRVDEFRQIGDWINAWSQNDIAIETINGSFSEVVTDSSDRPIARMQHDFQSLLGADGKEKALRIVFTFRGKPATNEFAAIESFFLKGRTHIVNRFTNITTPKAHSRWGRLA